MLFEYIASETKLMEFKDKISCSSEISQDGMYANNMLECKSVKKNLAMIIGYIQFSTIQ